MIGQNHPIIMNQCSLVIGCCCATHFLCLLIVTDEIAFSVWNYIELVHITFRSKFSSLCSEERNNMSFKMFKTQILNIS